MQKVGRSDKDMTPLTEHPTAMERSPYHSADSVASPLSPIRVVALMTDFGQSDTYVGQMQGVIAGMAPSVKIVDVTHEVEPQNVLQAALWLEDTVEAFSAGTIFCVVVDPGVGSARRALAAEVGSWRFVGPDNGFLSALLERWPLARAVELPSERSFRKVRSATFHGRDVFAPVAAAWAAGTSILEFGPALADVVRLPLPAPDLVATATGSELRGKCLWPDRFGNLVTNLRDRDLLQVAAIPEWSVRIDPAGTIPFVRCYSDVGDGCLMALIGSGGRLELAVRNGSALNRLGRHVELVACWSEARTP